MLVAVTFMLLATTAAPALAQNVHNNVHVNVINNDVNVSGNNITVNKGGG